MRTMRIADEELYCLMSGTPVTSKRITESELDALIQSNDAGDICYSHAWHEDSSFEVLVIERPNGVREVLHCERKRIYPVDG